MTRKSKEEDCPTNDFEMGEAQGKCWGDGHYLCTVCRHFRADFKANPNKREAILAAPNIRLYILKPAPEL